MNAEIKWDADHYGEEGWYLEVRMDDGTLQQFGLHPQDHNRKCKPSRAMLKRALQWHGLSNKLKR